MEGRLPHRADVNLSIIIGGSSSQGEAVLKKIGDGLGALVGIAKKTGTEVKDASTKAKGGFDELGTAAETAHKKVAAAASGTSKSIGEVGQAADTAKTKVKEVGNEAETTSRKVKDLGSAGDKAASGLNNTGDSADKADKKIASLKQRAGELGSAFGQIGGQIRGVGLALTAVAVGVTALLGATVKTSTEFDSLKRGLTAVAGSSKAAEKQLIDLREVAKLPGLGFKEAIRGSINLQAAGLSADLAKKSLIGFGNALGTVGKGKAELAGVLLALSQIQSKGKVQAEEITQIAERAPQVRGLMKSGFGTGDTEVLQKSGIEATDFIRVLVGELGKLPRVTSSSQNSFENLADTIDVSMAKVGDTLRPVVSLIADDLAKAIGDLAEDPEVMQALADGARVLSDAIKGLVDHVVNLVKWFKDLSPEMQSLLVKGAAFGTIFAAIAGPILIVVGQVVAFAGSIASLVTAFAGAEAAGAGAAVGVAATGTALSSAIPPILAVIAVVVGLVAAWKTNFWGFRDFIVNFVKDVTGFFKDLWKQIAHQVQGITTELVKTFQAWWPFLKPSVDLIVGGLRVAWELIKLALIAAWETIKTIVSQAVNIVGGIIKTALALLRGDWGGALGHLDEMWKNFWGGLAGTVKKGMDAVRNELNKKPTSGAAGVGQAMTAGMSREEADAELGERIGREVMDRIQAKEKRQGGKTLTEPQITEIRNQVAQELTRTVTPGVPVVGGAKAEDAHKVDPEVEKLRERLRKQVAETAAKSGKGKKVAEKDQDLLDVLKEMATKEFGLSIGSEGRTQARQMQINPGSPNSFHIIKPGAPKGRAFDVSGNADAMTGFFEKARQEFGPLIDELFLNLPGGNFSALKNGKPLSRNPEAGRPPQVHVAVRQNIRAGTAQTLSRAAREAQENRDRATDMMSRLQIEAMPTDTPAQRREKALREASADRNRTSREETEKNAGVLPEAIRKAIQDKYFGKVKAAWKTYYDDQKTLGDKATAEKRQKSERELQLQQDFEQKTIALKKANDEAALAAAAKQGPSQLEAELRRQAEEAQKVVDQFTKLRDNGEEPEERLFFDLKRADAAKTLVGIQQQIIQLKKEDGERTQAVVDAEYERLKTLREVQSELERNAQSRREAEEDREAEASGPQARRDVLTRRLEPLQHDIGMMRRGVESEHDPAERAEGQRILDVMLDKEAKLKEDIAKADKEILESTLDRIEANKQRGIQESEQLQEAKSQIEELDRQKRRHEAEREGSSALKAFIRAEMDRIEMEIKVLEAFQKGFKEGSLIWTQMELSIKRLKAEIRGLGEENDRTFTKWEKFWRGLGQSMTDNLKGAVGSALEGMFDTLLGGKGKLNDVWENLFTDLRGIMARALSNVVMKAAEEGLSSLFSQIFGQGGKKEGTSAAGGDNKSSEAKVTGGGAASGGGDKGAKTMQAVSAVGGALLGLAAVFAKGKAQMAIVFIQLVLAIIQAIIAIKAAAAAGSGGIAAIFAFDDSVQDAKARRWGFDFGNAFNQGMSDATGRFKSDKDGGVAGRTINVTQNNYGPINSSVDMQRSYLELGDMVRRSLRTAP